MPIGPKSAGKLTPALFAEAVTPDSDFSKPSRGLYVGTAGDVEVRMYGDASDVVFSTVPAGTILPVRASRVVSTNTTATNMTVLW